MSRSPGNAFKRRRLLSQTQPHAQVIQESESESEPESSDFSADEAQEQPTPRRATQTQSRRDVVADTEGESDLEEEDEPVVAPRPRASKARDAHERIQDSEEPQAGLEGLDNNHDHLGEQQQQDNTDEAAQDAWSSFAEEYYDMVEQLPLEVQRAFRLILEMEHETRKSMDASKSALQEYLSACRPPSSPPTALSSLSLESMAATMHHTPSAWPRAHIPKLSQVSNQLTQSSRNAGDKFSLASTLCESVDRHIQRLDADLTRLLEPVEAAQDASSEEDASGEEVDSDEFEFEDQTTIRSAVDERLAEDSSNEQDEEKDRHEEEEVTAEIVPPRIPPEKKKGTIVKLHPSQTQAQPPTASTSSSSQQQRKQKTKSPSVQPLAKHAKDASEQSKPKRKKASSSATTGGPSSKKRKKVPKLSKELLATLEDMPASADEPRYCYCNNVAMGDMVACDNEDCPREWFHLDCVGLDEAPEGDWYCNACSAARRVGLVQSKPSAQQKR